MLSQKQIQHLANLARIELTEKEIEKYQKEISAILDYVGKLKSIVSRKDQDSQKSVKKRFLNLRADQVKKFQNTDKLIDLAPEKEGRLIKVEKII